tara:strand:- start:10061 stop:10867 length:807 start_codon:yes stop_codon:yes gene_type:complete
MIQVEEIRSCEPILITESEYGYCVHTGDLSSITGARGLSDEARNYVLDQRIPYINFKNERPSGISKIVDYPGPSAFIHPPPYGPMDLAPVEYVGNLAIKDGYEVANIQRLVLPKTLSRLAEQQPSNRYQNIDQYNLPDIGQNADMLSKSLLKWAKSLRSSIITEMGGENSSVSQHTLMTKYRVYGVLFYELNLVTAGNGSGQIVLDRVGHGISGWLEHFNKVSQDYPESGHSAVRAGHKDAVVEITKASEYFKTISMEIGSPSIGPSR